MSKQERTKSLTFAYPSSPDAEEFNNGASCWMLTVTGEAPRVFQTWEKLRAFKAFQELELPIATGSFDKDSVTFQGYGEVEA